MAILVLSRPLPGRGGPRRCGDCGQGQAGEAGHVVLSPATATIAPGGTQAYIAGADASGGSLGDVTSQAPFTIRPGGSRMGRCQHRHSVREGTVNAAIKKVRGNALPTVVEPDLAASQTVNAAPFDYAPVTFRPRHQHQHDAPSAG